MKYNVMLEAKDVFDFAYTYDTHMLSIFRMG